ncbi:hypothetical protein PInf_024361 [Phytophthora infestans]|nr:hypothetical protein PInf_024361 [Phytophthora infestans]
MSHYGRAGGERVTLVVDVDHTLTKLLECAALWHEAEHGAKIDVESVASPSWTSVWGGGDAESKTHQFFESKTFETELAAVTGANEVLKPLRKYFSLLAITDRPRFVEKETLFDKLMFVDEDRPEHLMARKKELYDDLKVKVAVGSDASMLTEAAEHVGHVVVVGSVPWSKAVEESRSGVTQVTEWSAAKETFDQLIKELELKPLDKVFAGLVSLDTLTIWSRSRLGNRQNTVVLTLLVVFYANIINSKLTVQKQENVRLQASEAAITTAVQAAEILRLQNNAITTKISTRYALNRPKDRGGYRVPKLELVLQRVAPKA